MTELKPCPFCGGNAIDATGKFPGAHAIYCSNQSTCGNRSMYTVEDWNTRTLTPAQQHADEMYRCLQEELEFLQEAISQLTLKDALFGSIGERLVEVGELLSKARGE